MEFINKKEIKSMRCKHRHHKDMELKAVDGPDLYYQCPDCGVVVIVNVDW